MGALVDIGRVMIVSNKHRIGTSKISPPISNLQAGEQPCQSGVKFKFLENFC